MDRRTFFYRDNDDHSWFDYSIELGFRISRPAGCTGAGTFAFAAEHVAAGKNLRFVRRTCLGDDRLQPLYWTCVASALYLRQRRILWCVAGLASLLVHHLPWRSILRLHRAHCTGNSSKSITPTVVLASLGIAASGDVMSVAQRIFSRAVAGIARSSHRAAEPAVACLATVILVSRLVSPAQWINAPRSRPVGKTCLDRPCRID